MNTEVLFAVIYLFIILLIGIVSGRKTKASKVDFFLANRSVPGWAAGLSASASSESAWLLMGLVGAAYTSGVAVYWLIPGCFIGYLFNWVVIAPKLRKISETTGSVSIAGVIGAHSRSPILKRLIAVVIIVFITVYLAAQFLGLGRIFGQLFDLPAYYGILFTLAFVLAYTAFGGMRSSIATDVVQSVLMVLALIIIPAFVVYTFFFQGQPITPLENFDQENHFSIIAPEGGFAIIGLVLGWAGIGLAYPGQPHVLQRFMATRDDRALRRGAIVALLWSTLVFAGAITAGVFGRFVVEPSDPELLLVELAQIFANPAIAGIIIAAIVAAITSTADSQLLVVSSHLRDLLGERISSALNPRITTLVLGVFAALLALQNNATIFGLVLFAWEFLGVTVGVAVIGSIVLNKTALSVVVCAVAGALLLLFWRTNAELSGMLYALVPAMVVPSVALLFMPRNN